MPRSSGDLTDSQIEAIRKEYSNTLAYLTRLLHRMDEIRYPHDRIWNKLRLSHKHLYELEVELCELKTRNASNKMQGKPAFGGCGMEWMDSPEG